MCFLKKKKLKGDSPFQTQAWRENNSPAPSSPPSQEGHNGGRRGVSKPSVSNPQLSSFLTEALGSGLDGVCPVHVTAAERKLWLEALHPEHKEAPCSLVLSWWMRRSVRTTL